MQSRSETKNWFMALTGALLTLFTVVLFYVYWTVLEKENVLSVSDLKHSQKIFIFFIYALSYFIIASKFHSFEVGFERKSTIVASQVISLICVNFLILLIIMEIAGQFAFIPTMFHHLLLLLLGQIIADSTASVLLTNIYWAKFPPIQIIEIYGDHENDICPRINSLEHKYRIVSSIHYSTPHIAQHIQQFDAVLINDIPSKYKNELLKLCFERNKKVYFIPKISDILVKTSQELNVIDSPLYMCKNEDISILTKLIKRGFDIAFSLFALTLLSPLFLIIAVSIKLSDGGSVFFLQERCTLGGKTFKIIKFRSMIMGAENEGVTHPAEDDDKRITKVGRIIRATRLDELPQFINILKGDMSVVGPRPERIEHVKIYTQEIPEFCLRNKVKGGLTGYAQVYGKYNTSPLDKLKLDLEYIKKYSLLLDFEILIETIKVVFQKESTEGFSKKRVLEMNQYSREKLKL